MRYPPPVSGPDLPEIRLELLEDLSPADPGGFLRLVRRRFRAHYPDGSVSQPFLYDAVERRAIDAVVIVAHYVTDAGPHVYLRSSLRPPLFIRGSDRGPFAIPDPPGCLWELPAGLVEEKDQSPTGPRLTAQRELHEELGFQAPIEKVKPLGPVMLPAPGFVAEQHFYFQVEVDPDTRSEPALDGSPLEHFGKVIALPLDDALRMCREGGIQDAKTELGLRRLAEELS